LLPLPFLASRAFQLMPLREAVLASAAAFIAPASIMAAPIVGPPIAEPLIAEPPIAELRGEVWLLASVPLRLVPLRLVPAITTTLNVDITPTHPASKGHKPTVQRRGVSIDSSCSTSERDDR
jgi:hypothetical protein